MRAWAIAEQGRIGEGLSAYDAALKAVTINAAEIWGVQEKMGSIDEGKWADLVITDGDPLESLRKDYNYLKDL